MTQQTKRPNLLPYLLALLVLVGIVYVLDARSVVIQTRYFKYTRKKYGEGRRIFKVSPIHHHFELCKWSEYKIGRASCRERV